MRIILDLKPPELYDSIHELIRMAFPGCEIERTRDGEADLHLRLRLDIRAKHATISAEIRTPDDKRNWEKGLLIPEKARDRVLNWAKQQVRAFSYDMLCQLTGQNINRYGILTGMRPVKLVHRLIDQGLAASEIEARLKSEYRLTEEKARLLTEIAFANRPYLLPLEEAGKWVSIYIGIPYCPSRCYYCSFPGAVLEDYDREITPFMDALLHEIRAISGCLQERGLKVQTVYLGGGTPTVLSTPHLEQLFAELSAKGWITPETVEITVEAGRPDTLDPDKLRLMKAHGVNRICINPQSMNDSTLTTIGRRHDQKGVIQALEWAREVGIEKINMDVIIGLPDEGLKENTHTAQKILELRPDNITVHTLALKRGSLMAERENGITPAERTSQVEAGVELFSRLLREAGYVPYYLYRQKYMKASMENLGYARQDSFCLYNIQMIEERQTIIGVGGGAGSKFIDLKAGSLESFYNPKNPKAYCQTVQKLISRKVDKLGALN